MQVGVGVERESESEEQTIRSLLSLDAVRYLMEDDPSSAVLDTQGVGKSSTHHGVAINGHVLRHAT